MRNFGLASNRVLKKGSPEGLRSSAGPSQEGWGCPPDSFPSPSPASGGERGIEGVRDFGTVTKME